MRATIGQSVARLLRNRQLIATDAVGLCVLFTQVAMFTYVTFHLSEPPFGLSTAALGWLFVVYLVGAAVTPVAGHWIDARGHRAGLAAGVTIGIAGAVLTLDPVAARDRRRPGHGGDRRLCVAGHREQFHRQCHGGRSRPGRRAVLVLLLRRRQPRRRAAGPVLDELAAGRPASCSSSPCSSLTMTLALRFWTHRGRAVPMPETAL